MQAVSGQACWSRCRKSECFVVNLIERQRAEGVEGSSSSPLARSAHFRDSGGERLSDEAVEVLNILRPTVAIGRYIMFAAMALKDNPRWREALRGAGSRATSASRRRCAGSIRSSR